MKELKEYDSENEPVNEDKLKNLYGLLALVFVVWVGSIIALQIFYPELEDRSL